MAVWTPLAAVTVKVVGLAWRGNELLLAEVEDSHGHIKGLRPLGGRVEFGETREDALRREFGEELQCSISLAGPWHAFENIYEHEGTMGHEFIFAANILLDDERLYLREKITFVEDEGMQCHVAWHPPLHLPQGVALFPSGLLQAIEEGLISPPG